MEMNNLIKEYNERIEQETGVDNEVLSTIWETLQHEIMKGEYDVARIDQERAVRTYVQVMTPAARSISVSTRSNFSERLAQVVDQYFPLREHTVENDVLSTIRETLQRETEEEYVYDDDVALREQDLAMRAYARGEEPPCRSNLDQAIRTSVAWIEHLSYS